MIGNQNSHEMVARRAKESRSNSHARGAAEARAGANANRSKVHEVNSYNFYGDHSAQDSLIKRECVEPKSKKTKIVEVIDFGAEDTNQSRDN
jgi:putative methionine-R-sulfoxide reductase with GAF domain